MQAIRIHQRGGAERLQFEDVATPMPGEGEALIRVAVAGVNAADLRQRNGAYPHLLELPTTLGTEAAGWVEAVGDKVTDVTPGMRVAAVVHGGYAEYAIARADQLIPLGSELPFEQAVAIPVQGLTAYLLLVDAGRMMPGEGVLVHAASGGVGALAIQIARLEGATAVAGTSGSPEKLAVIEELGAVPVNTQSFNWVEQVMSAMNGHGVDVLLDPIGGEIGKQGLELLAVRGRLVHYGLLSGVGYTVAPQQLIQRSQSVSGFSLQTRDPEMVAQAGEMLIRYLKASKLRVVIGARYPLAQAADAHRLLEQRSAYGKVILEVAQA
jgi:NADPH2:quinone reductase